MGTIFQFVGVTMFLVLMFVCCASGLLSPQTAIRKDLSHIGWGNYSVPLAMTVSLSFGIFSGIALAGLGLGMQATHRRTPLAAILLTTLAALLYTLHAVYFAITIHSVFLPILCAAMVAIFAVLTVLAVNARRDMLANPPPKNFEILPKDYKVPYSHLHEDPPEVRLAKELETRRQRLAVQQKELELLEEKLKHKLGE